MESLLSMDIECFSDVDLIKCGVYAYAVRGLNTLYSSGQYLFLILLHSMTGLFFSFLRILSCSLLI